MTTEAKCPKCGAGIEALSARANAYVPIRLVDHRFSMETEKATFETDQTILDEDSTTVVCDCGAVGMWREFLNTLEVPVIRCGVCDCYHRVAYHGDCRNDAERFADLEDSAKRLGKPIEEVDAE